MDLNMEILRLRWIVPAPAFPASEGSVGRQAENGGARDE
jgi:hypothetical protein